MKTEIQRELTYGKAKIRIWVSLPLRSIVSPHSVPLEMWNFAQPYLHNPRVAVFLKLALCLDHMTYYLAYQYMLYRSQILVSYIKEYSNE